MKTNALNVAHHWQDETALEPKPLDAVRRLWLRGHHYCDNPGWLFDAATQELINKGCIERRGEQYIFTATIWR